MLVFVAILVGTALLLALLHHRDHGAGQVIYQDTAAADAVVLVSRRYGLKGKPDALVRLPSGDVIPIERKSSRAPKRRPYEGDLAQATAYCILVEEHYGRTPPFMRIEYSDRSFEEPYTIARKRDVSLLVERVRESRRLGNVSRSHDSANRCRGCAQRLNCDQALR